MLISKAFQSYATDVIAMKNQSAKTEENHYVCMKALLIFFGDVPIESLSFPMIRDWKLALDKGRSPETVRTYIIKFRVVLDYCQKQGLPVVPPDLVPVPKRGDKVPAFISKEEVAQLIRCSFRLRSKAIISLLYASGIRLGELLALDRDKLQDYSFTVIGKGSKARLCFFDERTKVLIDLYLESRKDNHPALFLSTQSERRMTPTNVQLILKKASRQAGITTHVTPHTLRHSFATNLLKSNTNIRYVQALLGHASLETTMMYTHVVNADLQAVYSEHHTI